MALVGVILVLILGSLVSAQIPTVQNGFSISNSSLLTCAMTQYSQLITSVSSAFVNVSGQPDINQIFSLFNASIRQQFCGGLNDLETCIKNSPPQELDNTIQQYINYDSIVPVTRRYLCSAGFEQRFSCVRQTVNASYICGGALATSVIGKQQPLGPSTLCPLIDNVINCTALHIGQCNRQSAQDYLRMRDMLSTSCRNLAENVQLDTPLISKIAQCSFSLVGRVIDLSNLTAASTALSNLDEFFTNSRDEVVRGVCSGIDQVLDCIASEAATSTYIVDVFSRALIDLTNAAQMKRAMAPVCNFAKTRFSDILSVVRCNVTRCPQPLITAFSTINFQSGLPSETQLRSTFCGPMSETIKCATTAARTCNADVSTLAENFAYDVLRTDCGGRRGNSAGKMVSNLALIVVSTAFIYWF